MENRLETGYNFVGFLNFFWLYKCFITNYITFPNAYLIKEKEKTFKVN